jgi:antitoxin component YwqK of YwqJK toxin-antitoxin module
MVFTLFGANCYAQKLYSDRINQLNENGQKEGYWIENRYVGWKREIYYKNGIPHGNYKGYDGYGRLIWFGNYSNGMEAGTWYSFGDYGELMGVMKDFVKKNTTLVRRDGGIETTFDSQCYSISYYPNGTIESEGLVLYYEDEGPWMDTAYDFGLWKYYNEFGELIKTENLK